MANSSQELNPTEPRPLLAFETFDPVAIPTNPDYKPRPFPRPNRPNRNRQYQRLSPQFGALQTALADEAMTLAGDTVEPDPEFIVVFEVAGTIAKFMRVAQGIDGLGFQTERQGDGFEPDDEFYFVDDDGDPVDKAVTQSLYVVMANAQAIDELVRLFALFQQNREMEFETGLTPLRDIFDELHTVRRWGASDRIAETGLLEEWRAEVAVVGNSGVARIEIELVWRDTPNAREADLANIRALLGSIDQAKVIHVSVIEPIRYHGVLAEIPPAQVQAVLDDGPEAIALLRANEVLFVTPAVPMAIELGDGTDDVTYSWPPPPPHIAGTAKVALLDGVPMGNHDALAGRIDVDDPHDRAAAYSTSQRSHGTAMASLIIHGDLNDPQPPISSPLYIQPILVPHTFFAKKEEPPPNQLFVDVVHSAFERMFSDKNPASETIKIVNLSVGDPARPFIRRPSPLARLIDYLIVKHNVLVIVSGGNHTDLELVVPAETLAETATLDAAVRSATHKQARLRRLMAPAESLNALTVGATHDDSADVQLGQTVIDPVISGAVAPYSPVGFGLKRSPKPEIHNAGGRLVMARPTAEKGLVELHSTTTGPTGPGLRHAAPTPAGSTSGTLHSSGTSNAAALTTHSAHQLLDLLEDLTSDDKDPAFPAVEYHPVLLKALLVHASSWPKTARDWADHLGADSTNRKRLLTQHMGFGMINQDRVGTAATARVCLIGAGSLKNKKRASFRFPLPPSLSSPTGWRRLTLTLAWFSPIVAATQQYRVAQLTMNSPRETLRLGASEAYHHFNGNGTVIHQVLDSDRAAGYALDQHLAIDVDCKARVGRIREPVRFGIAASIEVGSDIQIDLHSEVRQRLRNNVQERVQEQERVRP